MRIGNAFAVLYEYPVRIPCPRGGKMKLSKLQIYVYLVLCQAVSLRSRPVYLGALSDDLDEVLIDLDHVSHFIDTKIARPTFGHITSFVHV